MNRPGARSNFEKNLRIAWLLRATAYGFDSAVTAPFCAVLDDNTGLLVRLGGALEEDGCEAFAPRGTDAAVEAVEVRPAEPIGVDAVLSTSADRVNPVLGISCKFLRLCTLQASSAW